MHEEGFLQLATTFPLQSSLFAVQYPKNMSLALCIAVAVTLTATWQVDFPQLFQRERGSTRATSGTSWDSLPPLLSKI